MEESTTFFGNSIQDIEDDGDELFDSQHIITQSCDHQDTSTTHLNSSSIDAPLDLADPLSVNSIYAQTSGRLLTTQKRNQSAASQYESAESTSPGLSSGSSETPETRSSHQTTTPEDALPTKNNKPLRAATVKGFPPAGRNPAKKRRQGKQQVEDDGIPNGDATKRNRFLERNRVAATKCRQKKKEWVSDLEETRFGLEGQNSHLQMEYSSLKNEITHIKSQLMEHASCSDPNINKWIENEAKRFVLGTGERYDQMLTNLGSAPAMITRQESFSFTSRYPTGSSSELLSPVTPSHHGSISFTPGAMGPSSPVFYRPGMTSAGPDGITSASIEETYPPNFMPTEDPTGFDGVSMAEDTFDDPTVTGG
ncbi:mitochondrial 54S ribosomal protein YmL35 [Hypoxylon texense]